MPSNRATIEGQLEKALDTAFELARLEALQMIADGDVGVIMLHIGKRQIRVEATPKRSHEPVQFE